MRHSKPTLTVFADASVRKYTAGWGGWARGDGRLPVFASGKATHDKVQHVELEALAQTLLHLSETQYLTRDDHSLLLQSDSLTALQMIWGNVQNSTPVKGSIITRPLPRFHPWIQVIASLTSHCDVVYLKHVKGHQGGGTGRSWVNEQCDRLAKEASLP